MRARIAELRLEVERLETVGDVLVDELLAAWARIDELEHEAGA